MDDSLNEQMTKWILFHENMRHHFYMLSSFFYSLLCSDRISMECTKNMCAGKTLALSLALLSLTLSFYKDRLHSPVFLSSEFLFLFSLSFFLFFLLLTLSLFSPISQTLSPRLYLFSISISLLQPSIHSQPFQILHSLLFITSFP